MATRNPVVLVSGQLRELPAGDTINGAASSSIDSILGNFTGTTSNTTGTTRFYPRVDGTITQLAAWAGAAVPSATVVTLKKNGNSVGSVTIASGALVASPLTLSVAVLTTDYLTLDLASTGAVNVTSRVTF